MKVVVISGIERFMKIIGVLENAGINNITFYNATIRRVSAVPIFPFIDFTDFLILGRDAHSLLSLKELLNEARERNIPVISEDTLLQVIN